MFAPAYVGRKRLFSIAFSRGYKAVDGLPRDFLSSLSASRNFMRLAPFCIIVQHGRYAL